MFCFFISEHYHNQTAKLISAINFIDDYCKQAKLAIRMDDDVIFYPKKMVEYVVKAINENNLNSYNPAEKYHKDVIKPGAPKSLRSNDKNQLLVEADSVTISSYDMLLSHTPQSNTSLFDNMKQNSVVCVILAKRPIVRTKSAKYRLSPESLPKEQVYPDFCAGFFFVLTGDLIPKIRQLFYVEPPFWIDDSYLGVIQKRLQTVNIKANSQFLFGPRKIWRYKKRNTMKPHMMGNYKFSGTVVHFKQKLFDAWLSDSKLFSEFWSS